MKISVFNLEYYDDYIAGDALNKDGIARYVNLQNIKIRMVC